MATDSKIPLGSFIEQTLADAATGAFDLPAFTAGLESYGYSMPGYLSPLYTELATASPTEAEALVRQLISGVFAPEGGVHDAGGARPAVDVEIQSTVPKDVDPARISALRDMQDALVDNSTRTVRRPKGKRDFIEQLVAKYLERSKEIRGLEALTEESLRRTIEKGTERPIYARTEQEARQKLEQRLAEQDAMLAKLRQATREKNAKSAIEEVSVTSVWDSSAVVAETVFSNPTVREAGPAITRLQAAKDADDVWNHEKAVQITREMRIETAAVRPPRDVSDIPLSAAFELSKAETAGAPREAVIHHAFNTTLSNALAPQHISALKEHAAKTLGKEAVESKSFHDFLGRSSEAARDRSGGKLKQDVSEWIIDTHTPDPDVHVYLEAVYKSAPETAIPDPKSFFVAKAAANHPVFRFDYLPSPVEWIVNYAKERAAKKAAGGATGAITGAAVGTAGRKTAGEIAKKIFSWLGLSPKVIGVVGGPVTMIISAGLFILPSLGKAASAGAEKATRAASGGGLVSLRAASAAFGDFIQNATGGKYKDPNDSNIWYLALCIAIAPFLLAYIFTTTTLQNQRAQFHPIGIASLGEGQVAQPFNIAITGTPVPGPGGIPSAISYTVTMSALTPGETLSVTQTQVCFSVYGASGKLDCQTISPSQIVNGTYTFSVPTGATFNNAVITATVTATANSGAQTGLTGTAMTSNVIGNPVNGIIRPGTAGFQPAGWCNKDGASIVWSPSDWAAMMGGVAAVSQYPPFIALVMQYNPAGIPVYRIPWTGNYWGCTSSDGTSIMFIYNGGIPNATYILTHELGHRISASRWFCEFKAQGIMSEGVSKYAGGYTDPETRANEDFAESFALYMVNGLGSLPKHYNFVQQVFGLIPGVRSSGCN